MVFAHEICKIKHSFIACTSVVVLETGLIVKTVFEGLGLNHICTVSSDRDRSGSQLQRYQ